MHPSKLFPLVITADLAPVRAFYADRLGCALTHDLPGYLQVRFGDDPEAPELAFMPPSEGPDHGVFGGAGIIVSVPTADADAHHRRALCSGLQPMSPPSDEPWGWRSYALRDPAGVILDFFHVIAKSAAVDATG